MAETASTERLIALRRELHQHPEPAWREFWTTARLVEEIRDIGVDELYVGPEAIDADERRALPADAEEFVRWRDRALAAGADETIVQQLGDGQTGIVAVLNRGPGPVVALRVDIDALPRRESSDPEHTPVREGFRAKHDDAMHACGHDAHATVGIGVLERLAASDFSGTVKLLFQPAEEGAGGGYPLAESGHLDDVTHLLALHLGLGHPTGEVVAGIDEFLAVTHIEGTYTGAGAHAGGHPEQGRNAIQALATAIQNLYAIPRHGDGATRVNVGQIEGGTSGNIIADEATFVGEVRGATTPLRDYMLDRAVRVLENAGEMHECECELSFGPDAPSAVSDPALIDRVAAAAESVPAVDSVLESGGLDGSEDATFLMRKVQDRGGLASYVIVGTDHPSGHHSATFDVDEDSIEIAVNVLTGTIEDVLADPPA